MASSDPVDPRPSAAMKRADTANGEAPASPRAGRCVLIAVDESEASVAVARAAQRLLGPDATYVLVNVGTGAIEWADDPTMWSFAPPAMVTLSPQVQVSSTPLEGTAGTRRDPVAEAEATASSVATSAGLSDAKAVGAVARDRGEEVMTVAREHQADVIVLGRRHRNWMERMLSRSVTDDVVRHADCPVLVVP